MQGQIFPIQYRAVVSDGQYALDPDFFSNITLSHNTGNHVHWDGTFFTSQHEPMIVGGYRGFPFQFRYDNAGTGTLTFSYTYGGFTTSQSLNYTIDFYHDNYDDMDMGMDY